MAEGRDRIGRWWRTLSVERVPGHLAVRVAANLTTLRWRIARLLFVYEVRKASRLVGWAVSNPWIFGIMLLVPPITLTLGFALVHAVAPRLSSAIGPAVAVVHPATMTLLVELATDAALSALVLLPTVLFVVRNLPLHVRAQLQVQAVRYSDRRVLRLLSRYVGELAGMILREGRGSYAATTRFDLGVVLFYARARTRYLNLLTQEIARHFGLAPSVIEALLETSVDTLGSRVERYLTLVFMERGHPKGLPILLENERSAIRTCATKLADRLGEIRRNPEDVALVLRNVVHELSTGRALEAAADILSRRVGRDDNDIITRAIELRPGIPLTSVLRYDGGRVGEGHRALVRSYLAGFEELCEERTTGALGHAVDAVKARLQPAPRGVILTTGFSRHVARIVRHVAAERPDVVIGLIMPEIDNPSLLAEIRREHRAMRAELLLDPDLQHRLFSSTPPRLKHANLDLRGAVLLLGAAAVTTTGHVMHQRARLPVADALRGLPTVTGMHRMIVCEAFKIIADPHERIVRARTMTTFGPDLYESLVVGRCTLEHDAVAMDGPQALAAELETWRLHVRMRFASQGDIWSVLDSSGSAPAILFSPTSTSPSARS